MKPGSSGLGPSAAVVSPSGRNHNRSPPGKGTYDAKSKKFGGDRSTPTVYKGPSKKWSNQTAMAATSSVAGGLGSTAGEMTSAGTLAEDQRNEFEKAFEAKKASWADNDDRNDDALYHRSFDDGVRERSHSNP